MFKFNKSKELDPLPNFKTQEEENNFWQTHNFSDYTNNPDIPAIFIQTKEKDAYLSMYGEKEAINDPKLTEMVNVRFDKATYEDLRAMAHDDDRTMASLIRRWVMQKLKDEKYDAAK